MSNEKDALDALEAARKALKTLKSDNKLRPKKPDHVARREKADSIIGKYRKAEVFAVELVYDKPEWPGEKMKAIASRAMKEGAGNCAEYALVARDFLLQRDPRAKVAVVGLSAADHVFVAVGLAADTVPPKNMSTWGEDVWICDPWANIVCRAAAYPGEWQSKLRKWAHKHDKYLRADGHWVKATDSVWWQAVERSEKVIYKV
jgi:hypothetical protein